VVSFISWEMSPWHPMERRLDGLQSWTGHSGEEKKINASAGN